MSKDVDEAINLVGPGYDLSVYLNIAVNKGNEDAVRKLQKEMFRQLFEWIRVNRESLKAR